MTTQIGAGRRIHRLTVQTTVDVSDGMGGSTTTPVVLGEVYGDVLPASARDLERILPSVVTASASHLVTIPYLRDVTLTSTVVFHDGDRDRLFSIAGVHDPDERHLQLVLACEEAQ